MDQFSIDQPAAGYQKSTPPHLSSPLQQQPTTPRLFIGDRVTLPEGQEGILRYIGTIHGKNGEFAGVELINEFSNMGRHNGEFEG